MKQLNDVAEDRKGEWMHTSTGARFFPLDPRPEDICISDIANGLALDCRYGGQGRIDKFYSVAEHSYHMAEYARRVLGWGAWAVLAVLMHDAAEAYLNDLPRAVKHSVGAGYDNLEDNVQRIIIKKYGLVDASSFWASRIKALDCRIVPLEKAAIMSYPQAWAYDTFKPLEEVQIRCWEPRIAKEMWLGMYVKLCFEMGVEPEEYEI